VALCHKLAHANKIVDNKVDKLEEIAHGVIVLNKKPGNNQICM
jgi:hypothetical protein